MAAPEVDSVDQNQTNPLVARRKKLDALKDLGVDPWGGRFEGHEAIASIRARLAEVVYRTEGGQDVPLPDFTAVEEGFNFRQWKADQGKGEMVGPKVRAAGRIMLDRDKGKLHFIDIKGRHNLSREDRAAILGACRGDPDLGQFREIKELCLTL